MNIQGMGGFGGGTDFSSLLQALQQMIQQRGGGMQQRGIGQPNPAGNVNGGMDNAAAMQARGPMAKPMGIGQGMPDMNEAMGRPPEQQNFAGGPQGGAAVPMPPGMSQDRFNEGVPQSLAQGLGGVFQGRPGGMQRGPGQGMARPMRHGSSLAQLIGRM